MALLAATKSFLLPILKLNALPPGSVLARLAALCVLSLAQSTGVHAHECGPSIIHLKVGETCPWQITSDHPEGTSIYSPQLVGSPAAAAVTPLKPFQTRHGDFTITGKAPGTNFLIVNWNYPPTGLASVCPVQIIVTADEGAARPDRPTNEGALCTSEDLTYIYGRFLRQMLDYYIPAATPKFLIFSQCYGGDLVTSGHFRDAANTAVATGSGANQTGKYGGYHDDAARGLKPGDGRTARDVHEAGSAGKWIVEPADTTTDTSLLHFLGEWPQTGGALALENFPMAPVTTSGPVRSRHIVVYAGRPGGHINKMEISPDGTTVNYQSGMNVAVGDKQDRDTIQSNFAGQPNTTVRTVGGEGSESDPLKGLDGWDFPGTREGLRRAIDEAGEAIRKSPNPGLEQFILFVGDHGMPGRADTSPARVNANARSETRVADKFMPLGQDDPLIDDMLRQSDNRPGFQFFMQPAETRRPARPLASPAAELDAGRLRLAVKVGDTTVLEVVNPRVGIDDVNHDGIVDANAGEGWTVFFPVEEWFAIHRLAGSTLTLVLKNDTDQDLVVSETVFLGGAIERGSGIIPPPLILDVAPVPGGAFKFKLRVLPRREYQLEFSSDLVEWSSVKRIYSTVTTAVVDTTPPGGRTPGFYRLRFVP